MTYAKDTSVSVEKTRIELDTVLSKYRASQRMTGVDDVAGIAFVGFTLEGRQVKVRVPLPTYEEVNAESQKPQGWKNRTPEQKDQWIRKELDQLYRSRWRCLLLLTKAKLEAVELGISTVEKEFLAFISLPDGRSVHETLAADLNAMYLTGEVRPLLGAGS